MGRRGGGIKRRGRDEGKKGAEAGVGKEGVREERGRGWELYWIKVV